MKATRYVTTAFVGAFLLTIAAPVSGQIDDNRWLPFVGCWEPAEEAPDAGLVCFRPADGGVEMISVVAGEVVATEMLAADGERRPIVAEGCEGFESVSFSQDGWRVFTRTDIVCGDDARPGTGVMAVIAPTSWVDVRALDVQGETVAWTQVYELVGPERLAEENVDDPAAGMEGSIRTARMVAARDIGVDDVAEAAQEIDTEAVTAWVAAQSDRLELSGDDLVRLADSGVPERVIDVMVAVSYPNHFTVGAEQRVAQADTEFSGRRIPVGVGYRSYMMWDPFYSGYGYGYSPFGYGRSAFGYGGFGYGGFGYGGFNRPYGGYGYGPTIVRVDRRRASSNGRVVNGRGWTRSSGGTPGGGAVRRGGGSTSGGGYTGSSGSGSSRPAASGGRRAKPRGG